jgi:8-oxo-dGTP pyrophosphatase MutT (NUDIX family)
VVSVVFTHELRNRITHNLAAFQPRELSADRLRHAAVGVVVLSDETNRACFILTRRLDTLRRHGGQWALPGGRLEAHETAEFAALREIREEVGLDLPPEAILGRLDDFISRSGHLISPFVIWAADGAILSLSPDEVDAAYRVPLEELDQPGGLSFEPLLHFSLPTLASTVHAPTAAIIYQFREVALHGRTVRVADVEQPFFAWS